MASARVGAAAADANGPLQQGLEAGREGDVAAVDGVLDVAQQMGEADLMVLGRPSHLGGEAIGDPEIGADIAEEFLDHLLAAGGADDEAGAVGVMEDPGPEGLLADADAGLVRLQGGAGQQVRLDPARLGGEGRRAVLQHVGERAFADLQPEQVRHQPFQALERDRLAEAQVQHEGAQIRAERRPRLQPGRRGRLEPLGATGAGAADAASPASRPA